MRTRLKFSLTTLILLAFTSACGILGGRGALTDEQALALAALTLEAETTAQAAGEAPAAQDAQPAEVAPPTPTVQHLTTPGEPGGAKTFVTDRSTEKYAEQRVSDADAFQRNLYERPYTAEVMDYQAHLDIVRTEVAEDSTWIYATIFLEGKPPANSQAVYALELDLNLDGRGDWFISGVVPSLASASTAPGDGAALISYGDRRAATDWTTDGVRVFRDSNNDVGGPTTIESDSPDPVRDGYDELVFDQGLGPDPDAAWIRRAPDKPDRVQIAFKSSLIASDGEFLWGPWADDGPKDPAFLDYNDHFTPEEAGSPIGGSDDYPVKDLASVDNTCRAPFGFTPTENIPGMCAIPEAEPEGTICRSPTLTAVIQGCYTTCPAGWTDLGVSCTP